jgi:hypothetical protein
MRTTCKPWAGLAKFIVFANLFTGVAISHAAEPISVPPELAVGDLQLVFEKGVDTKNLQALVEETWAKSKALRVEALAKRIAPDAAKVNGPDNWMAALKEKKWLPEGNAYIRSGRAANIPTEWNPKPSRSSKRSCGVLRITG